jgi:hypothetical protein
LYLEIISICFEVKKTHRNTLCGQNVKCFNVKPGAT